MERKKSSGERAGMPGKACVDLLVRLARDAGGVPVVGSGSGDTAGDCGSGVSLGGTVRRLAALGVVRIDASGRVCLTSGGRLVRGRVVFSPGGHGVVEPRDGSQGVFVASGNGAMAIHGDEVLAWKVGGSAADRRRGPRRLPQAVVLGVVERRRESLTGIVRHLGGGVWLEATGLAFHRPLRLDAQASAQVGKRVVARLVPLPDTGVGVEAEVVEVLGPAHDPGTDIPLVLAEYGLRTAFPVEIGSEAREAAAAAAGPHERVDMRDRFVITVDPPESRDLDDALSLRREGPGCWEVCVHIADVSHAVRPGSALDREACARGCSVYFPGRVVPMLPEALSNGLCSLHPGVDRLALTAVLHVTGSGSVERAGFVETVIRSRRRFTYAEVQALLEGGGRDSLVGSDARAACLLRELDRLARSLRQGRLRDGALELSVPSLRPVVDASGEVTALEREEADTAHHLVEEFMLAANEAACRMLASAGVQQLHRVHGSPSPARVDAAAAVLREAGVFEDGGVPSGTDLHDLLQAAGQSDAEVWTATVLGALPRAEYSADNGGHFGLAKSHYAHFTSPIRRYPDLVTHRLLKSLLRGGPGTPAGTDLEALARHCSEREQNSQRAERHLMDMKRIRYLCRQLAAEPERTCAAVIVACHRPGARVYLPEFGLFAWMPACDGSPEIRPGERVTVRCRTVSVDRRVVEVARCSA
ncbi:MAG: VacB/RNase II family 3'-5' exoribonuclease [Lentisphaeria bacterium]|nr:VacB/RNase II family 3'-5' exoribonuclease [Lentisphaeria bacterium]